MSSSGALRRWLPVAVSALALAALLASVDIAELLDALDWQVARVLGPGLLLYAAVTLALEAACLLRLIEDRPPELDAWTAARIKCASYLLSIVHYTLGVGALALLLHRRSRVPLGAAASAVLLISSTDLLVVAALASAGAGALGLDLPLGAVAAAIALGAAGGLAIVRAPFSLGPLERLRRLGFFQALRAVRLRALLEVLALRLVFVSTFIGIGGVAFAAFDLEPGLGRLALGMLVVAGVSALPIAVAGLGTGQAALLAAFQGVAPPETLLALSLALTAGMIAVRGTMGLVFAREFAREAVADAREISA